MKNQYFRIKKTFERQDERLSNKKQTKEDEEAYTPNNQLSELINLLHSFVQQGNNQSIHSDHNSPELEARDKHPIIQWKSAQRSAINDRELEIWITNVCRTTFSATFNYYYTDQLSYEQARVFCAESILKNVVRLTQKMKLTSNQVKILDEYLQNKILPYMLKKYPLTGETDINKALQNVVQQINSFDQLENDFIYITDVKFSYRKSGNYNDLIMIVLNKVLKNVDQSSTHAQGRDNISNYKDFELTMSTIFQKVESLAWMNKKSDDQSNNQGKVKSLDEIKQEEIEKQKYCEKVKAYTSYLIGRKVSENVDLFKDGDIANEHLVVKHSSILRILTKWCEELQGKFTNANYMKEHLQNIETLGGDINSLNDQHREILDEKLLSEMVLIRQYLSKLKEAFFNEQSCELTRHLEPDDNNHIEPYEKAFGKFSCQTVKNLHTFIIKYLNRLIHGLVQVSYDWHRQSGYKNNYEKWSYPPNLVTFRVGDLIRCKCSSKEKQILAIFNELNRISNRRPDKLKIIRIKNRLRTQTNDILINIKFNNCLIGQIQLAVNSKKSKFAQCSNNFNHYLYQLQRCIFGPFSQLANIWKNIDIRSKEFQAIIRSEGRAEVGIEEINRIQSSISCDSLNKHDYTNYDLPFRCTFCKNYHSHNDVIISNVQCTRCGTFKCMRCQIQSMNMEDLKLKILGKKYEEMGKKVELASYEMPSYGFYVETDSRVSKLQYFKEYKINGILYYLGKKNNKIIRIMKTDEKSIKDFFYHNLVFKLKEETNQFIKMTNSEVKENYILPEYVQGIYKSEKEVLFLNHMNINPDKWPIILNNVKYPDSLLSIKKMEIENNGLKNIEFISEIFPNLESISNDYNTDCSLQPLTKLGPLKHIKYQYTQLTQIPKSIINLKNLEELNIYKNKVEVLPRELFENKSLKIINLKYNLLIEIPEEIGNLNNLNQLLLRGNNLKNIPDSIEKLTNLTILNIGKCGLKILNPKIGQLTSLKILDIVLNELKQIPQSFSNLVNLQKFKIQENNISRLPKFISNFTNLKQFTLYSNKLSAISLDFNQLTNLDILNISNNSISHIDRSISNLKSLSEFYLHNNSYQGHSILAELNDLQDLSIDVPSNDSSSFVPNQISSLSSLLTLRLRTKENLLTLTPSIKHLNQLQELYLSNNGLIEVPKDIIYLTTLEKIYFEDNQLTNFPVQYLSHLPKLEEANFKGNKFRKVEKELINQLKVLDFSNNQISEVEISTVSINKTLKKLKLRQNLLTRVPMHISQLKKLKVLDISYNKITILQQNLFELRNMEYLSFHIYGNPLMHIKCGNFIDSQMCQQSKIFINSLVVELTRFEQ